MGRGGGWAGGEGRGSRRRGRGEKEIEAVVGPVMQVDGAWPPPLFCPGQALEWSDLEKSPGFAGLWCPGSWALSWWPEALPALQSCWLSALPRRRSRVCPLLICCLINIHQVRANAEAGAQVPAGECWEWAKC